MKTLLPAVLSLFVSFGLNSVAQASWFQEHCSNGEGTLKMGMGHNENYVRYTERTYASEGMKETIRRDDEGGLRYDIVKETPLDSSSHQACLPNEDFGYGTWRAVKYRQVVIRHEDGKPFSKDAVGVSKDLMTLTADVVCEHNGNSQIYCKKD